MLCQLGRYYLQFFRCNLNNVIVITVAWLLLKTFIETFRVKDSRKFDDDSAIIYETEL